MEGAEAGKGKGVYPVDEDPALVEQEAVTQVVARDPGLPTKEEREAHKCTHLPFRCWCSGKRSCGRYAHCRPIDQYLGRIA